MSDKEQMAIARLQEASRMSLHVYKQPLVVTTSGGKDSSVCVALAQRAGIPFEVMHAHTTADAPETVYFVRAEFKRLEAAGIKCALKYPHYKGVRTSMWWLVGEFGPPSRWNRYCCSILKENHTKGRFSVTGVRWAESKKREDTRGVYEILASRQKDKIILNNDNDDRRRLFETCRLKSKRVCNPIIDWTDKDVWEFLDSEHILINPLYAQGHSRVGCIGCPLASTKVRYKRFAIWPKYKNLYLLAFDRFIKNCISKGKKPYLDNATDIFHKWMEDDVLPGQIEFKNMEETEETT